MGAAGMSGGASLPAIAAQIRKMMASGAVVIYIPHAREGMTTDHIVAADVEFALKGCSVVRYELHGTDDWRPTCRGRTRQGETIEISIRVFEEENRIQAVTVYKVG
jgi:hypothetical protein